MTNLFQNLVSIGIVMGNSILNLMDEREISPTVLLKNHCLLNKLF